MVKNESTMPGYGDVATWPAFNWHPLDPRHPEFPEDEEENKEDCNLEDNDEF